MADASEALIPPTDPRFEGAEFLNDQARLWQVVESSGHLRGARWRWSTWRECQATEHDPSTGEEVPAVWDHDHCHFCHDAAFSERYDGDLREGWTSGGQAGLPPADQQAEYHWVCPSCFEQYRDAFDWTTEGPGPRAAQ